MTVTTDFAQPLGLCEGWEIEFLLPGLGRNFLFNTANVQKFNRITTDDELILQPNFCKALVPVAQLRYAQYVNIAKARIIFVCLYICKEENTLLLSCFTIPG